MLFCGCAVNNSHLTSVPGLLSALRPGWSHWFLSQCVSHCLCLCFVSLGTTSQYPLHGFVSPLIRLQFCLLGSHHKEYFIALRCVCVSSVSLQRSKSSKGWVSLDFIAVALTSWKMKKKTSENEVLSSFSVHYYFLHCVVVHRTCLLPLLSLRRNFQWPLL